MLPSDPPSSRLRRLLHYFGLVSSHDERLSSSSVVPQASRTLAERQSELDQAGVEDPGRFAAVQQGARTALVYFGLAEGDAPSRYGAAVDRSLDDDIETLRARVAELEARLNGIEERG